MGADLPAVATQLVVVHLLHGIGHGAHPVHHIAARGVLDTDIAAVFARDRANAALHQFLGGPAQRCVDVRCAGEGLGKRKVHDFVIGLPDGIELAIRTGRPQIFEHPVRTLRRDLPVGRGQLLQLTVILKPDSFVQHIPEQHVYGSDVDAGLFGNGRLDLLFGHAQRLGPVYFILRRGGDGPGLFHSPADVLHQAVTQRLRDLGGVFLHSRQVKRLHTLCLRFQLFHGRHIFFAHIFEVLFILPRLVEVPGYRDLRLEQLRRHQTEICFQLLVGIVEYTVSPGHCQLRRHIPRALVAVAVHFPQGVAERQVFPDGVEPDLLQVDQAEVVVAGRTGDLGRRLFNLLRV